MRLDKSRGSKRIVPADTESGHIEKSSLRKQHATAIRLATQLMRKQTGLNNLPNAVGSAVERARQAMEESKGRDEIRDSAGNGAGARASEGKVN